MHDDDQFSYLRMRNYIYRSNTDSVCVFLVMSWVGVVCYTDICLETTPQILTENTEATEACPSYVLWGCGRTT